MKKMLRWIFMLLILSTSGFAQGIAIKGVVTDAKTGETLPAVNNRFMLGISHLIGPISIKNI